MKTQAETAARLFRTEPETLQKGSVIPDFELSFLDGTRQLLSQFRGRSNLVVFFTAEPETRALVAELVEQNSSLEVNEAKVLVISPGKLSAPSAPKHALATAAARLPEALIGAEVIITDRFGEVFAVFPKPNIPTCPSADEVVRWLEFINQQCEECSPPEWQD